MKGRAALTLVLVTALHGCGSSQATPDQNDAMGAAAGPSTGGTGGSSPSGTGGGSTGGMSGTSGDAASIDSSEAGPEGSGPPFPEAGSDADADSSCGTSGSRITPTAVAPDGTHLDCLTPRLADGGVLTHDVLGAVRSVATVVDNHGTSLELVVDDCPPGGDCRESLWTFILTTASAASLPPLAIPVGTYVHATYLGGRVTAGWGCREEIVVSNLPSWNGQANPISTGSELYLVVVSGVPSAPSSAPFDVSPKRLGCTGASAPVPCSGSTFVPDAYSLRFSDRASASPGATISTGASATFDAAGQSLTARDLVSTAYDNGCDYFGTWNYWVVGAR